MKKVLLLSALVASVASFAGTTGSVESYVKTTNDLTGITAKDEKVKEFVAGTEVELGVKTEVKVKDSGLSFGAKLDSVKGKLFNLATVEHANLVDQFDAGSNVWAKYEFPTISDVETYAKATLNLDKRLTLEGNAKTTVSGVELGLNSKLAATLTTKVDEKSKKSLVKPALVLNGYAKTDVSVIKDAKLELETKNTFGKDAHGFEYVQAVLSGKYNDVKDLELDGKVSLRYQINGTSKYDSLYLDDSAVLLSKSLLDTYELNAKYKGFADKKVVLGGKAYLQHVNLGSSIAATNFLFSGLKANVEYKGVENLTLTGNGNVDLYYVPTVSKLVAVKLGTSAKAVYEYKVTDKLTVSPELEGKYGVEFTYPTKDAVASHSLTLTPAVNTEYKVADSLTLTGKASLPVKFETKGEKALDYSSTNLKTELNVKYTW